MYFIFDLRWYSIHFDIGRYEQGDGGGGFASRTKSVKRDESYLSTVPNSLSLN